jgi:protein-tyrosine-phosphatase
MSAEYLLRKALENAGVLGVSVSSSGTIAKPNTMYAESLVRLQTYGCDASAHKQTKLTEEILQDKDLVICMSEYHRTRVRELGFDAVLFNEISYGISKDVLDVWEYWEICGKDLDLAEYVTKIIDYIHDAMPYLVDEIKKMHI